MEKTLVVSNDLIKRELVSLIVPTYNDGGTISTCAQSIQGQTYDNIEIILVNDGLTDNTGNICDAFAKEDSRIKVFHQKNQGLSATRTRGIEVSSGEYICFADGDDEAAEDYAKVLINGFERTAAAELVVSGIKLYKKIRQNMCEKKQPHGGTVSKIKALVQRLGKWSVAMCGT